MLIAIGCDHAGFSLKQTLRQYLQENKIDSIDVGCYQGERVDYPDFALKVAQLVATGQCDYGIAICGSGIGVSIVANKVKGIRAALCCSEYMAQVARSHNNANVLALGGRTISPELAQKIINIFLHTSFDEGRHTGRVAKIHSLTHR